MTKPSLTIITVVWNDLPGLRKTMESVASQNSVEHEHIVVDGGSLDGTPDFLRAYENHFPHLRWISEPDSGIYDAMNKGLRLARGTLVMFLNARDILEDADVVADVVESHRAQEWMWAFGIMRRVPSGQLSLPRFSRRKFVWGFQWVPHPTTVIQTALFKDIEFNESMGLAADQHAILRVSNHAPPHIINRIIAVFEEGGAHSHLSIRQRELSWHRIRVDVIGRSRIGRLFDRIASELIIAFRVGRAHLASNYKSIARRASR